LFFFIAIEWQATIAGFLTLRPTAMYLMQLAERKR